LAGRVRSPRNSDPLTVKVGLANGTLELSMESRNRLTENLNIRLITGSERRPGRAGSQNVRSRAAASSGCGVGARQVGRVIRQGERRICPQRGPGQPAGGTGPVEARTTSSGSNSNSPGVKEPPAIWFISNSTTALPIGSMGCRTVLSGGSVQVIRAESS
jgi:hypothetical protein